MSAYRPIPSPRSDAPGTPSRRAVLAAAAGGIAALAATAIGGVAPRRASAAVGDNLKAGSVVTAGGTTSGVTSTSDTNATWLVTQNGKGSAIRATTPKGTAGRFTTAARNKSALIASNTGSTLGTGAAIDADGGHQIAVRAVSQFEAIYGESLGSSAGVEGRGNQGIGVYGSSVENVGVWGSSNTGHGVSAQSGNGYGIYAYATGNYSAYIAGHARFDTYMDLLEMTAPSGGANVARVFARDNGSGKTQLCVIFQGGVVQVLATDP